MSKRKVTEEEIRLLRDVPTGEFVRRVTLTNKVGTAVYRNEGYDRSCKAYWLQNMDDINAGHYAHGDQKVLVGFTY